jgi:hypothetical protein
MEKAAAAEKEAQEAEAAQQAEEEAPAELSASAIKRLKKAELIDLAEEKGIEIDPKATNAEMADAIIAEME